MNNCKIKMPTPTTNILKFVNVQNKETVPFVIYADLDVCWLSQLN